MILKDVHISRWKLQGTKDKHKITVWKRYPWGIQGTVQFSIFFFVWECIALSDAQLSHHSLITMPYLLVCCFGVISITTNRRELHFEGITNPNFIQSWSFSAISCYSIHSGFPEEVRQARAHIYGARPATLNMGAIHNVLSRAHAKHISVSFASR